MKKRKEGSRAIIKNMEELTGLPIETFAHQFVKNPRDVVESMAADPRFAHLGPDAREVIARAFGFESFADIDVKLAQFREAERHAPSSKPPR
jgi:hypothetical protein